MNVTIASLVAWVERNESNRPDEPEWNALARILRAEIKRGCACVDDLDAAPVVPAKSVAAEVAIVIARYREHRPKSRPGRPEEAKVAARLREGYQVDDLLDAVDGCFASSWHQGENERGRAFNSLSLICRDSSHVDQFREILQRGGDAPRSDRQVGVDAVEARFLGRFGQSPLERSSTRAEVGPTAADALAEEPVRRVRPPVHRGPA